MVNIDNVCAALVERGLEIVAVDRQAAHMPVEAFILVTTLLRRIAPDPELPWRCTATTRTEYLLVAL